MNTPMTEENKRSSGLLAEVRMAAALAKLSLLPEEEARMCRELDSILSFAAALQGADTQDVPMTAHVAPLKNVFREDVILPSFAREDMLANAPTRADAFINVPKTFEEGGAEG